MTIVNNNSYKFTLPKGTDKYIDLPIEIKWDFVGQDDAVEQYQEDVVEEIVGLPGDFEVSRFAHASYSSNTKTDIKYDFHFFSVNGGVPSNPSAQVLPSLASDWKVSYLPEGFSINDVYYFVKPFTKSFFKLDFYDSKSSISQNNYFTVILPVQQGFTDTVTISSYSPSVQIKIPSFKLDYVGDKEGFFLYWLRKKDLLNINPNLTNTTETFYMTAKFFDARLGVFVKMTNTPQSNITAKFQFNPEEYFYYTVVLNYPDNSYQVFNNSGARVGTDTPIKWYEYVNP